MKTSCHPPNPPPLWRPAAFTTALLLALFSALQTTSAQQSPVVIENAVLDEDNTVTLDQAGETPEYVVVKNISAASVSLAGWSLSDDVEFPLRWPFPSNVVLPAGGSLLVFASGRNITSGEPYATNFRLPCPSVVRLYQQGTLRDQRQLISAACRPCNPVIQKGTTLKYVIPDTSLAAIGAGWTAVTYPAPNWLTGSNCIGYDSDPICDGLILYSTFDTADVDLTNRIIFDMSGPTLHNGTYAANSISIPVPGKIVDAAQFSGAAGNTSVVTYTHHPELNPGTDSRTFSIWVRSTRSTGSTEVIFHKMDAATSSGYQLTKDGDAGVSFSIRAPGVVTTVSSTQILPQNAWVHLAAVIDRTSSQLLLYRNGVQVDSKPLQSGVSIGSARNLMLAQGGFASMISFQGAEDEFIIWGRALTGTEINEVFTRNNSGTSFKSSGPGGTSTPYASLITTDVGAQMKGINSSAYVRIPFTIPNASLVSKLELKMQYDDGFAAYINGTLVAQRNAPAALAWNSSATADRPDLDALTPETIDLTPFAGLLTTGPNNVLAIHGLNFDKNDSRFLICPELCYEEREPNECYKTTNGREFWIGFPANAPDDPLNPLKLSVCITGASGTTGLVEAPFYGFSQPFSIGAGGSVTVNLTAAVNMERSDVIENKGVHITASQNVAVYGKTREDYTTDTFLAIPVGCLGSEHLVLGYKNVWQGLPDLNGSQFGIVAVADGTTVTVTPKKTTGAHPAGVAYSFSLNRGQTYLLRNGDADANPDPDDLSGTEIKSDKAIAVFGGHRCANINGTSFFCDTILEQILPVPMWSTEYCSTPLKTRTGPDTLRVMAAQNNTTVFIDGVAKALLNRGQVFETVEAVGRVITGDKPVMAAQYSNSSDYDGVVNADPFQINLQPTRSWLNGYRICTAPATEFGHSYVNVVAGSTADIGGLVISPAPLSTEGPVAMFGGRAYARYEVAPGTTYTFSGKNVGLIQYGFDEYDSYGNSGGMGFNDYLPPTFTTCPSDVTVPCVDLAAGCFGQIPDFAALLQITDDCCPAQSITVVQQPAAGTVVPIGDYGVVVTATDCNNNTTTCVIMVHVRRNWQQDNFPQAFPQPALEATIWGWTADPDGDRRPNRLEYALGTDPNKSDGVIPAVQVNLVTDQGHRFLEISYRRRQDDPSLLYLPQCSAELRTWAESLGHFETRSINADTLPGFDRVVERCLDSRAADNRQFFLRLKVRER